jgi:hypothetical protein
MKRISLLVLGLCATAWASGCCCWCHGYYSRYSDCDDGYAVREGRHHRRHRHRHHDDDDDDRCVIGDGNCCDPCCDGSMGSGPVMPGASMGTGCATCGTAQAFGGAMPTYGGMPFDPGSGWTIQSTTSTPVGNEPVQAPPSSSTPSTPVTPPAARAQGWAPTINPTPTPAPGLVPPPTSYNR